MTNPSFGLRYLVGIRNTQPTRMYKDIYRTKSAVMVDTSIIGVSCPDPTELKLRSLTKVSSINAVCSNGTNHCDYKDMQKSHNKVKIIEKVLFTAHLVFGDCNCQKSFLIYRNL